MGDVWILKEGKGETKKKYKVRIKRRKKSNTVREKNKREKA